MVERFKIWLPLWYSGYWKIMLKSFYFRFEEHLINVWLTLLHNYPKAVVLGKHGFY